MGYLSSLSLFQFTELEAAFDSDNGPVENTPNNENCNFLGKMQSFSLKNIINNKDHLRTSTALKPQSRF